MEYVGALDNFLEYDVKEELEALFYFLCELVGTGGSRLNASNLELKFSYFVDALFGFGFPCLLLLLLLIEILLYHLLPALDLSVNEDLLLFFEFIVDALGIEELLLGNTFSPHTIGDELVVQPTRGYIQDVVELHV